jgi:ABC-type transport system involved in cytochrome bd biosynthesis fused ATPase/permease subunit
MLAAALARTNRAATALAPFTMAGVALVALAAALALNWRSRHRRKLIALSFAVYAVVLVVSALFFIPELGAFKHSPESALSPAEWLARTQRWQHLSWLRGAVMYAAELPLLFALAGRAETTAKS